MHHSKISIRNSIGFAKIVFFMNTSEVQPVNTFVKNLKATMSGLSFTASKKTMEDTRISKDLFSKNFVFVRKDSVKKHFNRYMTAHTE